MRLLIVNFHYFREEEYPGGIYPVNEKRLIEQVDELAKHYDFVSQKEVAELIDTPVEGNFCLITFDDGLKEQMRAFDLLREKGIPSVYYIPTNAIKNHQVLDVHKLHWVRTRMDDEDVAKALERFGFSNYSFDEKTLENQYRYDSLLGRKVKYFMNFAISGIEKQELIDGLFDQYVADESVFAKQLYMDLENLITLSNYDCLGSHGENHLPLAKLSESEAASEILDSINFLEAVSGNPIYSFSYPYGGKDAVSDQLVYHFENTNIEFALTMWRGVNENADSNNKYLLKRVDTNDAPGGKKNSIQFVP